MSRVWESCRLSAYQATGNLPPGVSRRACSLPRQILRGPSRWAPGRALGTHLISGCISTTSRSKRGGVPAEAVLCGGWSAVRTTINAHNTTKREPERTVSISGPADTAALAVRGIACARDLQPPPPYYRGSKRPRPPRISEDCW